jgi:hypothetical protein
VGGTSYATDLPVTYHAPPATTFTNQQVDVNDTTNGDGNAELTNNSGANNIEFVSTSTNPALEGDPVASGFANGDQVVYRVTNGFAVGGLKDGATYRVSGAGGTNNSIVQLDAYAPNVGVNFNKSGNNAINDTVTFSGSGNWLNFGFASGQQITVSGAGANDGTYTLAGVNSTTLTLGVKNSVTDGAFTKTIESSAIALAPTKAQSLLLTFINDGAGGANDKIARSSGSWIADGYQVGQVVSLSGGSTGTDKSTNNGSFKITAISGDGLTLTLDSDNIVTAGVFTKTIAADKGAVHSLVKTGDLPMQYSSDGVNFFNADGRTFYVINPDNNDTFQLALAPSGSALTLSGPSSPTSNHKIGPESVDLLSPATGTQWIRMDITGNVSGAKLTGPGGISLSVLSPPIGDGVSSATAKGSGGGFVGVNINDGTITDNPTVDAYVQAGLAHAAGNVAITTSSVTNATASGANGTGGFVGVGGSSATSDQTNKSEAWVANGTRIIAGGNFDLTSGLFSGASAVARSTTGGAVGVAITHTYSTIGETSTVTLKDGSDVLAGNIATVAASSGTSQMTNAGSTGIGIGGDGNAYATSTLTANTTTELGSAAALSAREAALSATVPWMDVQAWARGDGGGLVAAGTGSATVNVNAQNNVNLRANSALTGYEGVDLIARYYNPDPASAPDHQAVNSYSDAFGRATGLFGYVDGSAANTTTLTSTLLGELHSTVTAGPRDPSDPLLQDVAGYNHLALYADTTNGKISFDAHGDVSRRSLAVGGSSESPEILTVTPKIDFSSDVVIFSGRSPELVIDSSGHIAKAVNIGVNGVFEPGIGTQAYDGSNNISVDNVVNDDPGEVYFNSVTIAGGSGAPGAGSGTWDFRDSFQQVLITNLSDKQLTINNIDVLNRGPNHPIVDLVPNAPSLSFNILRTVAPTRVEIEDFGGANAILLNGLIENPIGTTIVRNANGNVRSTKARDLTSTDPNASLVRTNIVDIESANGSVGQAGGNRINIDQVEAAGLPGATSFLTARAASDGSIFLGRNQFFGGELVQYNSSGTAIGGLTKGDYYVVVTSPGDLSIKLASVSDPNTVITLNPGASPLTTSHSLTPAQRFTVKAPAGDAYLDVLGRLRDASISNYSVHIDAVSTGGTTDILMQPSVKETGVANSGGVEVRYAPSHVSPSGEQHNTFFNTPDGSPVPENVGAFATLQPNNTIDSTYDIRALDTKGHPWLPGITAGNNIIVKAAQPNVPLSDTKDINVLAITEIVGGGTAGSGDQHHIDVLTNGTITLSEKTDDLRVGEIKSTQSDVTLNSPAAIIDALDDGPLGTADVTARNITMTAGNNQITGSGADKSGRGGVGTPGNFLEINVDGIGGALGVLNVTDTASATTAFSYSTPPFNPAGSGTYGVFLTETVGDMKIDTVDTHGDVTLSTAAGSLVDARNGGAGDDAANVIGNTINLYALGGSIGSPAAGAEFNQSQLNGNNDLEIDSQRYAPGTIGARATNHIYLTETDKDARVVLIQALTGDARFTVRETDAQGEDLSVLASGRVLFLEHLAGEALAHGLVNTPNGSVLLRVGDNITTDPNAQILAGHNIALFGDFRRNGIDVATPNDSTHFGTIMHLAGVIAHGPTASGYLTRIFGNDDTDQIYFDQTFLGGTNALLPGGTSQAIPQGGVMVNYSGGKTRAYGSNTPTAAGAFAPLGDAEDFFVVNQLQSMAYLQTSPAIGSSDTLTLDGQAGSDSYIINTAGSKSDQRNYVINVLDSGRPDDGVDTLAVWGRDAPASEEGANKPADDIFLLRRTTGISGETSGPSLYADDTAFVAVLHDDLAHAIASDPNADSSVRNQTLERINYDSSINGRLMVFGQGGNDIFAVDDNAAITTLDGGTGNDTFQIGQLYGLQRDGVQPPSPRPVGDTTGGSLVTPQDLFPHLDNSLTPQSIYGTVATTRGWLSAGATSPLLAQGGQGDDVFTVYSNQAALRLEGDDGNDLFTVRAFALAATVNTGTPSEEIDWVDPQQLIARPKLTAGFSTAAETDIRTGAGNNQVEYNINAPVAVDGGNGFDKLVILGTEFADHIVVTDKGIFGAGLTVTYANIEVLEIDGLEGDDTIDVLSTQPGVATRVIGGLGNDQINIAGDVNGEVVSRDVNGTSGVINNRISSADHEYDGLVADGIGTSVARGTQGQVVIRETDGFTEVREDGTVVDEYYISLAKAPTANVYVTVSAAMSPQEERASTGGYLTTPSSGDFFDKLGNTGTDGDSIVLSADPTAPVDYDRDIYMNGALVHVPKRSIVLTFTPGDWNTEQKVNVAAVDDNRAEGDRTVTISHSVLSDDKRFDHAIVRNVEVLVRDNDQPGIIVTQLDPSAVGGLAKYDNHKLDNNSTVLEGTAVPPLTGASDYYAVELAKKPETDGSPGSGVVRVKIAAEDSEAILSSSDPRFHVKVAPTGNDAGEYYVEFDSTNWNDPVVIKIDARFDTAPEDPHNTPFHHTIDTAFTTDVPDANGQSYHNPANPVMEQRLDTRVIDDENPGLFQVESEGTTLVKAGDAQTGPGTGDSYTARLTSAPKSNVEVALISDGQTDVVMDGSITYKAVGGLQPVQLFGGNVVVNGSARTITRGVDAELGNWASDGFTVGMHIRLSTDGFGDIEGNIDSITPDGQTLTIAAIGAIGFGGNETRNDSVVSQLVERGVYTGSVTYTAASQPFSLFDGTGTTRKMTVAGTSVTRNDDGNFIDDGFAAGQTISFGKDSTVGYVVTGFGGGGTSMTLASGPANGDYQVVNKLLGTLRRNDGTSWLDSGFLEGQLFQTDVLGNHTFKVDLITTSTAPNAKLDLLVVSDPPRVGSVVPNASKLTTSGSATMTVTQWAAVATFTPANWYTAQTISVMADPGFDIQPGHQNFRFFPKIEHRLDGIRGPLAVEGGATSADRSLQPAIMLPGENNGPFFNVPPQPPESMSIDTLNVYDDGSRQDLTGQLTSTALTGLNMGGTLDLRSHIPGYDPLHPNAPIAAPFGEPGVYPGGISFGSISLDANGNFTTDSGRSTIEVLNVMLGQGNDKLDILGTLVPGPDHNPIGGAETTVSNHGGVTAVHGGGNALLQVNGTGAFSFAGTGGGNAELARVDLKSWLTYGFVVGQRVMLTNSITGGVALFTITGFANQAGGTNSKLLLAGGAGSFANATAFDGMVAVVDDLSVAGSLTVPVTVDRIVRNDNLPWQNLGFAIGQQVAFTTGGVTKLYTITDFDNNGTAGPGSAMLVTGNTLTAGTAAGVVAEAGRNSVSGTFTTTSSATGATITRSSSTWAADGFAVGQSVMVSGQTGTLTVTSISGVGGTRLSLSGGPLVAANTGVGKALTLGIVRVGGDTINVAGAAAVINANFTVSNGNQITRNDGKRWDTDSHYAIGQQISMNGVGSLPAVQKWLAVSGETSAQLVVKSISADGKTITVTGTPLNNGSFNATVMIDSPLVVYGDTSQDALWYNGKPDKLTLGNFGAKPMPHDDGLPMSFSSVTVEYGRNIGTITRSDPGGSWLTSGFVPEGLITIDGVLIGTIKQATATQLKVILADLRDNTDLSAVWASLAGTSAAHTIVQVNRLGQSAPFFVFPLANPFLRAGNDVIDASTLYAGIPDGQLPTAGLVAYGGQGDDLIKGSQAGDILSGGSGNDQVWGGRGVDFIYGDAGVNVNLITRSLGIVSTAGSSGAKNLDPVYKTGRDLLYGDKPGSTASDIYGDYDDVIIGDLGLVTQDVAGPRDTTKPAPALPQDMQTTLRARKVETVQPQYGADDQIYGNGGQDLLLGGKGNDAIDGGAGMDLVFGDDALLDRTAHLNNFTSLRDEALGGTQIYSTAPTTSGQDLANNVAQLDPRGDPEGRFKLTYAPVWGDYVITEIGHAANSLAAFKGNDYIAGGAGDDTLLGELGNDVIQGDGSIDFVAYQSTYDAVGAVVTTPTIRGRVGATRGADGGGTTGLLSWFASFDNPTTNQRDNDGHDYVEGGGGDDVVFGNQGQDDIVGGSSDFFVKTDGFTAAAANTPATRPDGNDLLFGGSGVRTARNDIGAATINTDSTDAILDGTITTTATGHADDADMILGDNGDIIRLVGTNGAAAAGAPQFLTFNYDNYGSVKLVARAARLLDYTPGGPNYTAAALNDIGGNDEVHGESGDDSVYGGKGDDRLYGDGQNDDLIGNWGNDWISGGTGDDGVIGDDGRIFTSRNTGGDGVTFAEPLYGIHTLLATDADPKNTNGNVLNEFIYTPGDVQTATINVAGELNKTVDITPYSSDPNWDGSADEYGTEGTGGTGGVGTQPNHVNDDIIYGGLGSDWLHGGTGDDAISGAEALPTAAAGIPSATTLPLADGTVIVDNLVVSGWLRPYNPGNILGFDPVDANGQHADHRTRAGEFALYDEYNPLEKIVLAGSSTGPVYQFLLNFNETEGVLQPGGTTPGNQNTAITYPAVHDDGGDRVFGDLGNDWLVGGTGRDALYGGMGNDLMNADDNLNSTAGTSTPLANNVPDTAPTYEDRAFGGAGRDVLIGNTGGDRLIDWTGEFNSYLVPFAPFGTATVSRTLQPQLPEFLYALSGSDGADATRYSDTHNGAAPPAPTNSDPMPSRNGEPLGELGLVLQKDAAWPDTHGGPSDPQAGNIPGGQRDVLRSANFNDGTTQGFVPATGAWSVTNGRYQVSATSTSTDAVSLFNEADTVIPSYFEMQATINAVKPTGGVKANAYLIFDYQNDTNFKFAGFDVSTNKVVIGHRDASGWVVDNWNVAQLKSGTDYVVMLAVNDVTATLTVGTVSVGFTFTARIDGLGIRHGLHDGLVGVGANGASAQIDNVVVQAPPGSITLDKAADFTAASPASLLFGTALSGTWTTTSDGRFVGSTATSAPAIDFINIGALPVTPGSLLEITATLRTSGRGGIVFDYQGSGAYKYVTLSADAKQLVIGHVKAGVNIVDGSYAVNVSANTDYKLQVSLRAGLVNVSLNGSVVLSTLYEEATTAGAYGLISFKGSSSGQTSYDSVRVRTDEIAYAPPPAHLIAAESPVQTPDATSLAAPTASQLDAIVTEAKHRWAETGLNATQLAVLDLMSIQVANLGGLELGETSGATILIDGDAAGYGWFVDPTPGDDREFNRAGIALDAAAANHMDLLSVVGHELGHALGLSHTESGLMDESLSAGTRVMLNIEAPADAVAPVAGLQDLGGGLGGGLGYGVPQTFGLPGQGDAPRINWDRTYGDSAGRPAGTSMPWVKDFVQHLGRGEAHRNPNASLRIHIPVTGNLAPSINP